LHVHAGPRTSQHVRSTQGLQACVLKKYSKTMADLVGAPAVGEIRVFVGGTVGAAVGCFVGAAVGAFVGVFVGAAVDVTVGVFVGCCCWCLRW
jgi:hypothetical protein